MSDEPATPLNGKLPPGLIRALAKNNLHTVEEVRNAYPLKLLRMHGIGRVRLQKIEAALIDGEAYAHARNLPKPSKVAGSLLEDLPLPIGLVRCLARNDIFTEQQVRDAYPEKLLRIRSFGESALRQVERVFFPGQHYELPRGTIPAPSNRTNTVDLS